MKRDKWVVGWFVASEIGKVQVERRKWRGKATVCEIKDETREKVPGFFYLSPPLPVPLV